MKAKAKDNGTLEEVLLRLMDTASKSTVRKLIKNHRILVDGQTQDKPDHLISAGQSIEVAPMEKKTATKKPGRAYDRRRQPFTILHEDKYLIVVDKPAGLLSISTEKENQKTLYRMVSNYVKGATGGEAKIFIVHRLDRDVSGVMVFAKDQKIKHTLQDTWASAEKIYHAIVEGRPPETEGTIKNWLCENSAHIVYICKKHNEGAAEAITHYQTLRAGQHSLLEVRLETGRKHQIRVHLASLNCPIVGDGIYGNTRRRGSIALHAHKLSFDHPVTGQRITFTSPMPNRFLSIL